MAHPKGKAAPHQRRMGQHQRKQQHRVMTDAQTGQGVKAPGWESSTTQNDEGEPSLYFLRWFSCDLQGRKIDFTNSKTFVGRCH